MVNEQSISDRELIEAAARVAGLGLGRWDEEHEVWYYQFRSDVTNMHYWNPLTDDGDALRLAVRLGIQIKPHEAFGAQAYVRLETGGGATTIEHAADHHDNFSAVRRAIVRAAAALSSAPTA